MAYLFRGDKAGTIYVHVMSTLAVNGVNSNNDGIFWHNGQKRHEMSMKFGHLVFSCDLLRV